MISVVKYRTQKFTVSTLKLKPIKYTIIHPSGQYATMNQCMPRDHAVPVLQHGGAASKIRTLLGRNSTNGFHSYGNESICVKLLRILGNFVPFGVTSYGGSSLITAIFGTGCECMDTELVPLFAQDMGVRPSGRSPSSVCSGLLSMSISYYE